MLYRLDIYISTGKFNSPSDRTVWHFKYADSDHVKRALDIFNWESALNNLDANDQVAIKR